MPGIGDTNRLATVFDHIVASGLVYPTMAAGATVVSANVDWTMGNYATIVPINTITSRFHVHSISIETCNRNAVFELELYHGATRLLVAGIRFAVAGGFFGNALYPISSILIPANEIIEARIASSNGTAEIATVTMSICYCIEV